MLSMGVVDRVLDLMSDGVPRSNVDVAKVLGIDRSVACKVLRRLWIKGLLLRSSVPLTFSFVSGGKRVRFTGYIYVRGEPGVYEYSYLRWDQFRRVNVEAKFRFEAVPYSREYLKSYDRGLVERVLNFFREREIGATAREVALALNIPVKNASKLLGRMWRRGLLIRKGKWNEKLGREVPFGSLDRKTMLGWIYGLSEEQCDRRIRFGDVLDPMVQTIVNEVRKHNNDGRFCPLTSLREQLNVSESSFRRMIDLARSIYRNLRIIDIGDYSFAYFEDLMSKDKIEEQLRFWRRWVEEQHKKVRNIGRLWEVYGHHVFDFAERAGDFGFEMVWWKQQRRGTGEWKYNITLSNRREVDRVLQLNFKPFDFTIYLVFEFKYRRGGLKLQDAIDFLDKLRTSREFGYKSIDGTYHLKENVIPVLIGYAKREEAAKIRKLGIILIEGWKLHDYLAKKNIKARFDKLINIAFKRGLDFQEMLKTLLSE